MPFSLLNGLSAMGAGVAQYAGTAGLELEKGQLLEQQARLADQLAGQRELTITQPFQASQQAAQIQSAKDIEAARAASSEKIAGMQQTTSLQVAGMQSETSKAISKATIDAESDRLAKTLAVTGTEVTIDANTGNAVKIDKATGNVTPILTADGTPLRTPNPELSKGITATMNTVNEELRNLNQQRSADLRAAQDQLDRVSQRVDLIGPDKDAAIAAAQKNIKAVQDQYAPGIAALQARLSQASAALLGMAPGGAATTAAGNRPPIGQLLNPGAADVKQGLINGQVPPS